MIKKCLCLIVLFGFAVNGLAQRNSAELSFKDGTVLKGLGKLKRDVIKFKKNRKAKAVKYYFSKLDYAKIDYGEEVNTYRYLKIKDKEYPLVLQELVLGKVNLYQTSVTGYNPGVGGAGGFGAGVGFSGGGSYSIENYFVKRKGEKEATHLGSTNLFSKNFKKAASGFFKDCPALINKIQNKEYKKRDIKKIIEYYNIECQ